MIKLTATNGMPLHINPDHIVIVTIQQGSLSALISLPGMPLGQGLPVRETTTEVLKAIERAKAPMLFGVGERADGFAAGIGSHPVVVDAAKKAG